MKISRHWTLRNGLRFVIFGASLVILDRLVAAVGTLIAPSIGYDWLRLVLLFVSGIVWLFVFDRLGRWQANGPALSNTVQRQDTAEKSLPETAGYSTRLEILRAIATQSTSGMLVESIIQETLHLIQQHFPDMRITYSTIDEATNVHVIETFTPPGMPSLNTPRLNLFRDAPNYLATLNNHEPLVIPDLSTRTLSEAVRKRITENRAAALISVPVHHSEQLIGLLGLEAYSPHNWTDLEVVTMREVAEHLAIAIHDAEDLQERKQAATALHRSEELYRLIAENSTDMISKHTIEGQYTYVSDACRSLLGYEPEELLGKNAYRFFHPSDQHTVLLSLVPVLQGDRITTVTYRIRRKDGQYIWFETTSRGINNPETGQLQEVICSSRDITQRHEVQVALQESEDRFRQITDNIDDLFWIANANMSQVLYMSPALTKIWGLAPETVYANPRLWLSAIHPDDLPHIQAAVEESGGLEFKTEHRVYRLDGEMRWVSTRAFPIYDADGKIFRYAGISQDITEKRRSQAAESEQREFTEALSESARMLNGTLDLQEVLERIIDSVAQVLPPSDLAHVYLLEDGVAHLVRSHSYTEAGKAWEQTNPELDISRIPNLFALSTSFQPLVISDTRAYADWVSLPGAESIRSNVGTPIILDGVTIGLLILNSESPGTFKTIHGERLQAFANQASIAIRNARLYQEVQRYADLLEGRVGERTLELEETNEKLQVILETTAEGICYTKGAKIQYANRAFYELLGYSSTDQGGFIELWGTDVPWEDDKKLKAALVNAVGGNSPTWRGEQKLRRKDGIEFIAGITISWINHSGGDDNEAVTILRDISQEKSLEAQRDRFIANASHELRTPLTNLKLRLYLLRKQPEQLTTHLNVMEFVSEHMHNLVDDLLDMTRFERGVITLKKQPTAMQSLVRNVIMVLEVECTEKQISLVGELPQSFINVDLDRQRITQVITNLIVNAIHYTEPGGEIRISLSVVELEGKPFASLQVCDSGIGIAPELQARIFEPFVRASENGEGGTGLGLAIVAEIIALHGGRISLKSAPNQGSTFTVLLPIHE